MKLMYVFDPRESAGYMIRVPEFLALWLCRSFPRWDYAPSLIGINVEKPTDAHERGTVYHVTDNVTLSVYPIGDPFLPEDMRGSRHPESWKRQRWGYEVCENRQTRIRGDDLSAPQHASRDDVAATVCAFISAESESYSRTMGAEEPIDGWLFGNLGIAEFAYQYGDEFACLEDTLRKSRDDAD